MLYRWRNITTNRAYKGYSPVSYTHLQIAAQIARKRVSLMQPQEAFNAAYFSELIDAVSLHVGGGVVLHTKTETDICESEEEPNGSPENSETDSFRN